MKLSIVTTLYQSESYLDEFYQRIIKTATKITNDYELILVNDGSPDQVLNKALQLQKTNKYLVVIDLSRNFGHHEAGMVGLEYSQGEYVFLIDSDLEEAPELLGQFWKMLVTDKTQADVVYGVQKIRKGRWFERYSGDIFYFLFNQLSDITVPANLLTVRLMTRQFVNAVVQYQEKHLFVAALMAHAGFTQCPVEVIKLSRQKSSYTLGKKLKLFLTCITSYSSRPLEYIFIFGIFLLSMCALFVIVLLTQFVFFSIPSVSHTLVISLATCFISAVILCCSGILGLYLGKIYDEVKQRPRAIIKMIYQGENTHSQHNTSSDE